MVTTEREPVTGAINVSSEQLHSALAWLTRSSEVSNQLKISILSTLWLIQVESFRRSEDKALADGGYDASLDEHRVVLSKLISRGEKLLLAAKQSGMTSDTPFTAEDLKSTLESLHVTFHCEHRNSNTEAVNTKLAELFNAPEPED